MLQSSTGRRGSPSESGSVASTPSHWIAEATGSASSHRATKKKKSHHRASPAHGRSQREKQSPRLLSARWSRAKDTTDRGASGSQSGESGTESGAESGEEIAAKAAHDDNIVRDKFARAIATASARESGSSITSSVSTPSHGTENGKDCGAESEEEMHAAKAAHDDNIVRGVFARAIIAAAARDELIRRESDAGTETSQSGSDGGGGDDVNDSGDSSRSSSSSVGGGGGGSGAGRAAPLKGPTTPRRGRSRTLKSSLVGGRSGGRDAAANNTLDDLTKMDTVWPQLPRPPPRVSIMDSNMHPGALPPSFALAKPPTKEEKMALKLQQQRDVPLLPTALTLDTGVVDEEQGRYDATRAVFGARRMASKHLLKSAMRRGSRSRSSGNSSGSGSGGGTHGSDTPMSNSIGSLSQNSSTGRQTQRPSAMEQRRPSVTFDSMPSPVRKAVVDEAWIKQVRTCGAAATCAKTRTFVLIICWLISSSSFFILHSSFFILLLLLLLLLLPIIHC